MTVAAALAAYAVCAGVLGPRLSRLIGACVLRLRAEYATPGGGAVAGLTRAPGVTQAPV